MFNSINDENTFTLVDLRLTPFLLTFNDEVPVGNTRQVDDCTYKNSNKNNFLYPT